MKILFVVHVNVKEEGWQAVDDGLVLYGSSCGRGMSATGSMCVQKLKSLCSSEGFYSSCMYHGGAGGNFGSRIYPSGSWMGKFLK